MKTKTRLCLTLISACLTMAIGAVQAQTQCVVDAYACADTAGEFIADCAEDTATDGLTTYECASEAIKAGFTCAAMAQGCGKQDSFTNQSSSTNWIGSSSTGQFFTLQCAGDINVDSFNLSFTTVNNVKYVTRVDIVCSNGTNLSVGRNYGSSTYSFGCNTGRMLYGATFGTDSQYSQNASYILGGAPWCMTVSTGSQNGQESAYVGDTSTGSGNYQHTTRLLKCPAGQYVRGMNVTRDNTGYTYLQRIRGIQLLCG